MSHIVINKESECCGCKSCQNICPVKAISMVENSEGFLYPHIDEDKCINCGACLKVCPWLKKIKREKYLKEPICIAAKVKDKSIQLKSSSGGLFGALALYVLENNGLVVGSELDSHHQIHHTIIDNKKDLFRIMGSKYVYSDLREIFFQVKKNLNDKKLVLFSGVPCQISALLNFLQKPYDNLITVEVICHGAPPQKLFDKYVNFLENKYSGRLVEFMFRSKKAANWGTFKALATFKTEDDKRFSKKINADFDPYYWSFLNFRNFRESCYECKFANPNRNADITLGDFWGIENIRPEMIDYNGVSIVIINTIKGKEIFEKIKNELIFNEVDYKKVQETNGQLKNPSKRPMERDNWYADFENPNFIENIKINKNIKSYVKIFFPQKLKFKIKKLISIKNKKVGE